MGHGLLDDPVQDGGYTQRALFPGWFGNPDSPHRSGLVSAHADLDEQTRKVFPGESGEGGDGHTINTRRPFVGPDPQVGLPDQLLGYVKWLCLMQGILPQAVVTNHKTRMMWSLRSTAITAASSLLRTTPPLCPALVLRPLWGLHLDRSLNIGATGSHVPHTSLGCVHATSTPDATWPVIRLPPGLSRSVVKTPVSTSVIRFSTLHQWFACARLRSPHLIPSCGTFSSSAHHKGS